jgi:PAS domain S-box-containing protein
MESKKTTKERLINQLETLDSEHEDPGEANKAIVINYQALLDNINDGVYMLNKKGRFVFINRVIEERSRIPFDKFMGLHFLDIVGPKDHERVQMNFKKVMRGEEVLPYELEYRTAHGKTLVVEVNTKPIYKAGEVVGLQGVSRNITKRRQVEEALVRAKDKLERRVKERTAKLVKSNELLAKEIQERKKAERELRKREKELRIKTRNLEEANTALRVLLKKRDEDRTELEEKVLSNVKELVLPYLEKLKRTGLDQRQKTFASILESNIDDIVSRFLRRMSSRYIGLTPAQIQVATLVRQGKRTKDIAELLDLSSKTIEDHRKNLRKKLGLKNKKANLRTHLLSIQ